MLRVTVAGSGYFSRFHLDAWQRHGEAELVALASKDSDTAEALAAEYGVVRRHDDVGTMLAAETPDLLDIVTPPETHLALVEMAAEAGIDVICQKPLAPTLDEAKAIVETAETAGIRLIVHENFRFMPWYRHCRLMIDQGRLGQLHGLSFRLRPGDGQGPEAYLARQPYFQTMQRFLIHETGIHFIDVFRYLLGDVTSVYAALRRLNPAIAGEDAGHVIFEFGAELQAHFDGNRLNDHEAEDCRLTMGEMHLEGSRGVLRLDGRGHLWWKPHGKAERSEPYDLPDRGFGGDCVYALTGHVIDHLLRGAVVENDGRAYLTNMIIEEAIYQSNRENRRITLEPL